MAKLALCALTDSHSQGLFQILQIFHDIVLTPLMRIDAGNVKTGESRVHNVPGPTPAPASLAPTLDPS